MNEPLANPNNLKPIVYSSTNCSYCKQLKTFFEEHGVEIEERNIDTDLAFARELRALGMTSVPVTVIGQTTVLGMNPTRIRKALLAN